MSAPRADDEPLAPRPLSLAPAAPLRGMAPRRAALEGRFARLEPLDPRAHGDALFAAAAEPSLWDYLPYGPFADRAAFDAYLRGSAGALDPVFFAIVDRRGGAPSGVASFLEIDAAHGLIEIGHIWLGPSIQRGAVGSEALMLMMAEAMEVFGARRLQWKCDAMNARSRAAARRYGFRFEGVLAAHRVIKGRNRDTAYYSILAEEWPAAAAAHRAWLSADNLTPDGVARRSLSSLTADLPLRGAV